jgi:multiple sugar transport system permease protein
MFPRPIERSRRLRPSFAYKVALPIALILWLLPLLGVAMTSLKPSSDLAAGNYFGWPEPDRLLELCRGVHQFADRAIHPQLVQGDDPHGDRRRGDFLPVGLCAGDLPVPHEPVPIFFLFVAGNFVPFQILMVPVRDLTVSTGLYNTITGLCCSTSPSSRVSAPCSCATSSRALPFELIEAARVEGVSESRSSGTSCCR